MFIFPPIKWRQYSVIYFLNAAFLFFGTLEFIQKELCVEASKVNTKISGEARKTLDMLHFIIFYPPKCLSISTLWPR